MLIFLNNNEIKNYVLGYLHHFIGKKPSIRISPKMMYLWLKELFSKFRFCFEMNWFIYWCRCFDKICIWLHIGKKRANFFYRGRFLKWVECIRIKNILGGACLTHESTSEKNQGVMKRAACCWPRKRQPSTSTVNIDCRKVQDGWLHFSSLSAVDARRRPSPSILQPFSSRPKIVLNIEKWQ